MKKTFHRNSSFILQTVLIMTVFISTFFMTIQNSNAEESTQQTTNKNVMIDVENEIYATTNNNELFFSNVEAAPRTTIENGTLGTVEWTFDDQGVLTFGGGEFPTVTFWEDEFTTIRPTVTKVIFTAPITAGNYLHNFFANMVNLTEIVDLNFLDTTKTTNMKNMFRNCMQLTSVDMSQLNTANVTSMESMFNGCAQLTTAELSTLNTNSVTTMSNMFNGCGELVSLDLSGWDTSNVKSMSFMFSGNRSLLEVDVSSFNTSNVTDMGYMFNGCFSLATLDVANWDTSKVNYMGYMFLRCSSLTTLDVGNWNTSNLTNTMAQFNGCSSLISLDVSNWDVSKVDYMAFMFENCSSLKTLDVSRWNTASLYHTQRMFVNCKELETIDVSNWSTSKLTNASGMFQDCLKLKTVDPSNWDTSALDSMYFMFSGCESITSLDLSQWNTSKLVGVDFAFQNCLNLESLNVSTWDTTKFSTMTRLFANCSKLKSLDLSNWDTTQIIHMSDIFLDTPLEEITIGPSFRFLHPANAGPSNLNEVPVNDVYSGKWVHAGNGEILTHQQLLQYDGTMPGTYKWYKAEFLLKFDLNGRAGTPPADQRLSVGQFATKPTDPTHPTEIFKEWTLGVNGNIPWVFNVNTMPANTVTLYAQWIDEDQPTTPPKITDDGGPFTEDECGTIRDRWGNIMYQPATCKAPVGYVAPKTGSECNYVFK